MSLIIDTFRSFKTLPFLRDILVPSSSFRASYAVNKFEYLNEVLHIEEVKDYVERNVDELVSFVQFFSSMEVQHELNQSQMAIDRAGFIITIAALFIAAPSFLVDFIGFPGVNNPWGNYQLWLAILILVVIGFILRIYFKEQIKETFKMIRDNFQKTPPTK